MEDGCQLGKSQAIAVSGIVLTVQSLLEAVHQVNDSQVISTFGNSGN